MQIDLHIDFKPDGTLVTPQEFVAAMNRAGIDKAVVLAVDTAIQGMLAPGLGSSGVRCRAMGGSSLATFFRRFWGDSAEYSEHSLKPSRAQSSWGAITL